MTVSEIIKETVEKYKLHHLDYADFWYKRDGMQIEKLIETYQPTMLLVEHDERFKKQVATKVISPEQDNGR